MTLETFICRHGEPAIQGMIENWERFMGISVATCASLEERWQNFMGENSKYNNEYMMAC